MNESFSKADEDMKAVAAIPSPDMSPTMVVRRQGVAISTITEQWTRSSSGSMTLPFKAHRVHAAEVAQKSRLLGFGVHWGVVVDEMRGMER